MVARIAESKQTRRERAPPTDHRHGMPTAAETIKNNSLKHGMPAVYPSKGTEQRKQIEIRERLGETRANVIAQN